MKPRWFIFSTPQTVKPEQWIFGERVERTAFGPLASGRQESFGPGDKIPSDIMVSSGWASDYRKAGYKLVPLA